MTKILLFLATGLLLSTAQARTDVSCFQEDCLRYGWEIYNYNTGVYGTVDCINESCEENGWVERDHYGRVIYEADCFGAGCFLDGWAGYLARASRGSRPIMELSCLRRGREPADCLRFGWEITDYTFINRAFCIREDCRKYGWDLHTQRGILPVRCKQKGCFVEGWHHL